MGTKICINENIVILQLPTFSQGIWRWYNRDSKDDLYHLFKAVLRYYKWYKTDDSLVFSFILDLAKKGLDKLIETYSNSNKTSIIHTLTMYKTILSAKKTEMFDTEGVKSDDFLKPMMQIYDNNLLNIIYNLLKLIEEEPNLVYKQNYIEGLQIIMKTSNKRIQTWIKDKITN